jgi:hypothetical protein
MRRGVTIALAAVLVAALATPLAEAAHNKKPGKQAAPAPAPAAPSATKKGTSTGGGGPLESLADGLGAVPAPVGIALTALLGVAILGVALLAARRAFHPPPPKPPRKSFAAGRAKGVRDGIRGSQAALEALARSGMGELASVAPQGAGYRVILRRGRGVPCEHAAGYVTGLFEAAWALDVHLEHPSCGGKSRDAPCVYEAYPSPPTAPRRAASTPAPTAPTSSGRAGAAASIRG